MFQTDCVHRASPTLSFLALTKKKYERKAGYWLHIQALTLLIQNVIQDLNKLNFKLFPQRNFHHKFLKADS